MVDDKERTVVFKPRMYAVAMEYLFFAKKEFTICFIVITFLMSISPTRLYVHESKEFVLFIVVTSGLSTLSNP